MKRKTLLRALLPVLAAAGVLTALLFFPPQKAAAAARREVVPGGELVGIRLRTRGVTVVGVTAFDGENGKADPAGDAGVRAGDILLEVDGEAVGRGEDLTRLIEESGGKTLELLLERGGEPLRLHLKPEKTGSTGLYKGGLWVRDSTAGIGTLTFSDPVEGRISTLGHGIYDADTGALIDAADGEIFTATVTGVTPGAAGAAGEIGGRIGDVLLGSVDENGEAGVYGNLYRIDDPAGTVPVASAEEVHTGAATVICTVSGEGKQAYDLEITRLHSGAGSRRMTVRVTDTALLAVTGGIVQGMSGAPILQDGMLVGAVTHVFVNDPRAGYAIYAEDMLRAELPD